MPIPSKMLTRAGCPVNDTLATTEIPGLVYALYGERRLNE